MRLRSATEADFSAIPSLLEDLGYQPGEHLQETYHSILHSDIMEIILAEDSAGHILGLITYSFKPQLRLAAKTLEIDEVVVAKQARGQGVGKLLLDEVKERALRLNCSRISVTTNRSRESYEREFYQKNGFSEVSSALFRMQLR